jgi:hypothetical protein
MKLCWDRLINALSESVLQDGETSFEDEGWVQSEFPTEVQLGRDNRRFCNHREFHRILHSAEGLRMEATKQGTRVS